MDSEFFIAAMVVQQWAQVRGGIQTTNGQRWELTGFSKYFGRLFQGGSTHFLSNPSLNTPPLSLNPHLTRKFKITLADE